MKTHHVKELSKCFISFCWIVTLCYMLQETLKGFFPSWEHIKAQEEVIVFTCGLMKDPTPLVEYVYENYIDLACNVISPIGIESFRETDIRLQTRGKNIYETNLFDVLYTESRVPLSGHAYYNQFVYINENHVGEREIVTPSKLYMFDKLSEDDVPVTKFAEQDRSEEAPECALFIQEPDAAAMKNLLSTCCEISKLQPVTHLCISSATCEDLTPAEAPALSRNVQDVFVTDCHFPMIFWKKILHQLFDCVNLQSLWLWSANLHQLEEDLDELFQNIDGNTGLTEQQVEVYLSKNNFSETFVKKWNGSSSGIICNFELSESSDDESESSDDESESSDKVSESSDDESESSDKVSESSGSEDGLSLDQINWLMQEQALSGIEINVSRENITADLVNALEISEPVEQLILRECSISDGSVFEAFLGLPANKFITVLDLGGTKLGHNAIHISSLLAHGNLKQLLLRHCRISTTALDFILPLLSSYKELTHLDLCENNLAVCGRRVAEFIMAWGDKPALKELNLGHCSMTKEACMELMLALGNCKSLTRLNMTANFIQGCLNAFLPHPHEGLHSLREFNINQTGLNRDDLLHLAQLLKNKLSCLSHLDLGNNSLHRMEDILVSFVQSCVTHYLRKLKLKLGSNNLSQGFINTVASLCKNTSTQLDFKLSLPIFKSLSIVDYGCTNLGFDARHVKNMIQMSWLKEVCLRDCHIPSVISGYLLSAMCVCKNITHVDMSGNTIDKYGHDLAETIQAWGPKTVLKELDLSHCSIPSDACRHLLSVLGSCRQLLNLWLPGNTLTGSLSSFIPDQHAGLPSLQEFFLNYTTLNKRDLLHLAHLIRKGKLPELKELDLGANSLYRNVCALEELVQASITNHERELKLCLWFNSLPSVSVDKFKVLCNNTNTVLCLDPADD